MGCFQKGCCLDRNELPYHCSIFLTLVVDDMFLLSTNSIIRVTLNTESDTVCLNPPNAQVAKSEVLNFGVPG